MQHTLFPEIYRSELAECVGFLAAPLLILNNILHSDGREAIITAIKRDQEEQSKARALLRDQIYKGGGVNRHMNPELVLLFLTSRAFYPDCYGERGYQLLLESESIKNFLANRAISTFPSQSTVHEQVTAVSETTLVLLNQSVLSYAKELKCDDMSAAIIDSTAIEANSAWPVDSSLLKRLAAKLSSRLSRAHAKMSVRSQRSCSLSQLLKNCDKLAGLDFYISNLKGKRGAPKKRSDAYHEILNRCDSIIQRVKIVISKLLPFMDLVEKELFNQTFKMFQNKVLSVSYRFDRAPDSYDPKTSPKVNSIGDNEAVFIKKGGRETVFGYRPSFSFSINGFMVCHTIELGNTSDSKAFNEVLKEHEEMAKTKPAFISVDDGYCAAANLDEAITQGASVISFSGSKGKKLLGATLYDSEQYRLARHIRSASEAGISQIKNTYRFKRFSVCGIDRIRQEMGICMFGYNISRIVALIMRREETIAA